MYEAEIQAASWQYPRVPQDWIAAVIGAESSYRPVTKPTWEPGAKEYSYGPMQVLGSTARWLGWQGALDDLMTPSVGIAYGTAYLNNLIGRYGLNFDNVISAYNRGHADPVAGAGYISRVLEWLPEPVQQAAEAVYDTASDVVDGPYGASAAGGGLGGLLLAGAALWFFTRKRR